MAMAKELKAVDMNDQPRLERPVEQARMSGEPATRRRNGEDSAALMSSPLPPRAPSRARPVTHDDALFRLVGIGKSGIPGGVSEKKHTLLTEAYRPR